MTVLSRPLIFLLAMHGAILAHGATPSSGCLPEGVATIVVRIGDGPARAARLEGGFDTPLSLFDAASGSLLWSAAAHPSAIQHFPRMDAGFTGSLAAVDLDGDQVHDRIYAGDTSGRLWRLDLNHGSAAGEWATGGVFADFTNTEGRGFLAPPDVSLSAPPGSAPWLNIAVGTAAPGNPAANNRFYVLRDHAVHEAWTAEQYRQWRPLGEDDLHFIGAASGVSKGFRPSADADDSPSADAGTPGWYVELGSGHVIVPTLTVHHRAVLVIAAAIPSPEAPCEVFARIADFDLLQPPAEPDGPDGRWGTPVAAAVRASGILRVGTVEDGIAECTLDGLRVPVCDLDTRPRKTWWRRADAE